MKMKVKCVAAARMPTPKPEHDCTRYHFAAAEYCGNGEHGESFLDGQIMRWDRDHKRWKVGEVYTLELEMTE
jgi:hypothetical protein